MSALSPIYSPVLLSKHVFLIPESALCLSVCLLFYFCISYISLERKGVGVSPSKAGSVPGVCGTKAVQLSKAQPTTLRETWGLH